MHVPMRGRSKSTLPVEGTLPADATGGFDSVLA